MPPLGLLEVAVLLPVGIIDPIVRVDAEDSLLAKEATKTKVVAELPEEEEEAPGEGHTKQEVVLGPAARPLALTENPLLDIAIYSGEFSCVDSVFKNLIVLRNFEPYWIQ